MQIFDPFVCVHKPALALWVHRRLQLGERLRCNHFAVVRKDRHAHQKIPVRLIEQPHIFGEAFHICKMCIRDSNMTFVPLQDELRSVKRYLLLEQMSASCPPCLLYTS